MGSFETKGDLFNIEVEATPRVIEEQKSMESAHNDIINFIIDSAKQMAAFLQTDHNETGILRTPSRRMSKRKRSSVASSLTTGKKAQTSLKVRDVTTATPRRFSKRCKRSTLRLDTTIEQMEGKEVSETVVLKTVEIQETVVITEEVNGNQSLEIMDTFIESPQKDKIEIMKDINVNDVYMVDNKVMSASELMSELSIKDDQNIVENKANESENEWMTDDEDNCQQKTQKKGEFYDAVDASKSKAVKNSGNNSFVNKTLTSSSAKEKRKKSVYYTPQTTQRSTRAQTRMLSRIQDSSQKTPQTTSRCTRIKDSNLSGSGESQSSSRWASTSSNRSVRSYSRIQKKSDNKALTDSAMKRRQEAEEQRRIKLLASQEKEQRAMEKRRILLEEKVKENKLKSQEKANRVAELRERQKQIETERLKRELEKREELDRRRNEERREQLRKRQEETNKKANEIERRKQLKETLDMELQKRRQEELERKERERQEQERERLREQEKMAAIIQNHNSSLQQKAVANCFIKKFDSNTQLMPKVVVNKLSPSETAKHLNSTYNKPIEPKSPEEEAKEVNTTYVKKKDMRDVSSYDMTPPPKERDYENYDISEIQSDDDTDDEQQPRKRIPPWARGQQFIEQVHHQYHKSQRAVFREVKVVFGSGDALLERFQVEFELMFPEKPIHPKYAKRTSSAVWEEPPSRYRFDESSLNMSLNK